MFKFILPRFILRIERWKWNKEYRIYVSNMGHFMDEHKRLIPVKINSGGYVVVPIGYDHGYPSAHRIVMKTWRPTMGMEELTVDHLDHNKRNNALYNLEWVTVAENRRRAAEDYISDNKKVYKNMYTFEDFDFYIGGERGSTIEEAWNKSYEKVTSEKSKKIYLHDFTVENLTKKYQKILNICNNDARIKKDIVNGTYIVKYCGKKIWMKEKKGV
ncbi:MAG: HNH endonuclease [Bacilli bacterium]|nr:HNH endonuclease [Bacilli bacterium]